MKGTFGECEKGKEGGGKSKNERVVEYKRMKEKNCKVIERDNLIVKDKLCKENERESERDNL